MRAEWQTDRGYALFNLYGRLKPGLTMEQAEADLNLVADSLAKLYPRENADTRIQLTTEVDGRYADSTRVLKYGGLLAYDNQETTRRFFPELLRRIEAQPGVRTAALVNELPLQVEQLSRGPIVKEGEADPPPNQGVNSGCNFVTPKYFDTLRTPLVLGRDFTDLDSADAPHVTGLLHPCAPCGPG